MGLLDQIYNDPTQAGISGLAQGLLAASAPSRMPVTGGQAIGMGMQGMNQGYAQGMQNQRDNAQMSMQQQQAEMMKMQMLEAQRKLADQQATRQATIDYYKQRNGGQQSGTPSAPAYGQQSAPQVSSGKSSMYQDKMNLADFYARQGLYEQAQAEREQAIKLMPKFATEFRQAMGEDGKLHNYQLADDGTYKDSGLSVKPDIQLQDLGGSVVAVDKNALPGGKAFTKTMTAAERDASARGWNQINHPNLSFQETQGGSVAFNPKTGGVTQITGADGLPLQGGKGLTEIQGKATTFALRARDAADVIDNIGNGGKVQPGAIKRTAESVPLIGDGLGTITNWTQSSDQQKIEQAQRDFVNAVLRLESGASISPSEFDSARRQYFPQPGDTPEVIAQKKQNRETEIKGLSIMAGPGAKEIPAAPNAPVKIKGDDDYAALPSGALFIDPFGKQRRKP